MTQTEQDQIKSPHHKQLAYLKKLDNQKLIISALHHILSSELFSADMGNPWRDALVDELWQRSKAKERPSPYSIGLLIDGEMVVF